MGIGDVVATIGMFDGVHRGHRFVLDCLKRCCAVGVRPLVVTFRNHPLSVVNPAAAPKLLSTAEEKHALLEKEGVMPLTLDFNSDLRSMSSEYFMELLRDKYDVRRLVTGFNNRFGCDMDHGFPYYRQTGRKLNIEVEILPEFSPAGGKAVSSSAIRRLISDGNVKEANGLLGYDYTVTGTVSSGKRVGRTIGFPTANISVGDSSKLIPCNGVYAARAMTPDGSAYLSVVNIGNRPTVDNDGTTTIEAYLDLFSGDLYGKHLSLAFVDRIREERRFPSIDALKCQIGKDLSAARLLI